MKPETTIIQKPITSAFVLDQAKLARILNIMEERFTEAGFSFKPKFEVTLGNGRHINTRSVDQLITFDNSVKNPIVSLTISDIESAPGDLSCELNFNNTAKDNINLKVESVDSKRASQSFAELEEQVERTLSNSLIHKFTPINILGGMVAIALLVFLGAILVYGIADDSPAVKTGYMLSMDELNSFAKKAKEVTNTNDKIDFLFALESRQLERSVAKQEVGTVRLGKAFTLKNLFIMLPLIVILGCVVYLQQSCYPFAVFLWGDYEERYNKLLSTRRTIWTVVIGSLFIGILGNLFVFGLSSSIR
jgi:hypothetical protein